MYVYTSVHCASLVQNMTLAQRSVTSVQKGQKRSIRKNARLDPQVLIERF